MEAQTYHNHHRLRLRRHSNTTTTKMVNTRAKTKKTLQLCTAQPTPSGSDHRCVPSAAVVGSNDDLLAEILLRLPSRSVLGFKSVSRRWRSLVTGRRFTVRYDRRRTSPGLFFGSLFVPFDVENPPPPPLRGLDFRHDVCGIRIVQSCDGLLLCCSDRGNERARRYYVFNPTTKQSAVLPPVPGGQNVRKTVRFMALSFDRTTEPGRYRAVCIHRTTSDDSTLEIKTYSSEAKRWQTSNDGESFHAPYYTSFQNGVHWNGAVFWAPSCAHPSYFDLATDRLRPLPMPSPQTYQDGAVPLYFGASGGHLHMVESGGRDGGPLRLNVYEMKGDRSGWFVRYRVGLDDIPDAYPEMVATEVDPSSPHRYRLEVVGVVRGEKEEGAFMVVKVGRRVVRYNLMEKSFKEIYELSHNWYGRTGSFYNVHDYIESLASF